METVPWILCFFVYLRENADCHSRLRGTTECVKEHSHSYHIKRMLETQDMCSQHFQRIFIITLKSLADRSSMISSSIQKNIF